MSETYDKIDWYYGWNGGERPVHPETEVEVILRSGSVYTRPAIQFPSWGHRQTDNDIIAFRITRLYREPKKPREWWILDFGTDADQRSFIAVTGLSAAEEADPFQSAKLIHVREVLEGD